jgi:ferredoxin-type protein NapH
MKIPKVLANNKWRYLSLIAGFFLFVAPFALLTRAVLLAIGNTAEATLHTICFRMPLDWFFGGRFYALIGSVSAAFILVVVLIAFFAGPLFCGWLCPVGSATEALSRAVPIPKKFRFKIRDTKITSGLRYGFLLGFIAIAMIVGFRLSTQISSICCRYCSASVMQNLSSALFGNPAAAEYWHTGSILVLFSWVIVGGLLFTGGRGWCLFFCPLGAVSNLAHKAGAKLGSYKITFDKKKCSNCENCQVSCPTWAIKEDKGIDRNLCIACNECTHSCNSHAYKYQREASTDTNGEESKKIGKLLAFSLAACSIPLSYLILRPCSGNNCTVCPASTACIIILPSIAGLAVLSKSFSKLKTRFWHSPLTAKTP